MTMIVCSTLAGGKKLVAKDQINIRRSAYALTLDREQLLLVRLLRTGKYWFPGGATEAGETLEEALLREVHEETGVRVAIDEAMVEVENYWCDDTCGQAFRAIGVFFRCHPLSYELSKEVNPDQEWEQPEWVSLNTLASEEFQDYGAEIAALIRR